MDLPDTAPSVVKTHAGRAFAVGARGDDASRGSAYVFELGPRPTVPSAAQNLQTTSGDGQVVLTWEPPSSDGGSPITNYRIYRGTSSGGEILLTTIGNALTYTDSGLTNGQTFYYQVSAANGVEEGRKSNESSVTPTPPPTPPQAAPDAADAHPRPKRATRSAICRKTTSPASDSYLATRRRRASRRRKE